MKLRLLATALLFLSIRGSAQNVTKVFDKVKDVTVKDFGSIKKNNVIKGYYTFYEFDKVDRKTILFRLNLLDENLNPIGTGDITGPKSWSLLTSGFDGTNFCFKFYDEKEKTIELRVYDQQAKEIAANTLKTNYNTNSNTYQTFGQIVGADIYTVGNAGFCNYTFNDPNNSFVITYINNNSQASWQQTYEPEAKSKAVVPKFLTGDDEMILTGITRIDKGLYSLKTAQSIAAYNTKNGSKLFDVSTTFGENHVVPINAILEDGKITIIGLNYLSEKTYTSAPEGLAFIQMDRTGKVLKSSFKTFDESFGKYLPIENHQLTGGYYLYFHNIIRSNRNTNLIIAEKFKKAADAGGIALSLVGGGPIKLKLENMVVLEYDLEGNIKTATEIPKAMTSTAPFPSYSGFFPAYYLASWANGLGLMDYMFTTQNSDNSEIAFSFVDHGKIDDASKSTDNFGQIKYKNGTLTTDKLPIKDEKATLSRFLPAKSGHVLQMNYFKKDKKLEMNLIKLNN
ncbi:DUF6770 family protein [Mucilaginibacter agri]|uniref:PKD-like family protein n=1 Tax=Mucilaginibacter agri TaxID=2695265 RepID=A0A965ZHJ3_9SPHI|nr:DUF6770 family protein [Mucilaginibacter agri]NCD70243.1 hypothetical protein [Mucilaginibacter agri]